ncbi:type IV pilus biogenesis protein PilM [Rubeoparvulum massiliense]|uniref:type IV pilus biogenesis protein PilM n=1 Tax=Rubeoparvulum massiliense TaxID=1631346 RepID=UPI00065DE1FC|nr:pilus assembly protein PilM [Rubeoparvulum massiliense]
MAFYLGIGRRRRINIVIKDHVIRYVESKQSHLDGIGTQGELYLPPGLIVNGTIKDEDELYRRLAPLVKERKWKNRAVQFIVPDPYVVVRKMKVPPSIPEKELKGYLYMELDTTVHLPFKDPYMDVIPLHKETEDGQEILLIAAPAEIVNTYTHLFSKLKMDPVTADISPLALYRLYEEAIQGAGEGHLLLIQFDYEKVTVSIFDGDKPLFMRTMNLLLPENGWEVAEEENGKTNIQYLQVETIGEGHIRETITEILRMINYYQFSLQGGMAQIDRAILCGEHPLLDKMHEQLQAELGIAVCSIHGVIRQALHLDSSWGHYELAIGLALRGGN